MSSGPLAVHETDTSLVGDPDRMLPLMVIKQDFHHVAGNRRQIIQIPALSIAVFRTTAREISFGKPSPDMPASICSTNLPFVFYIIN